MSELKSQETAGDIEQRTISVGIVDDHPFVAKGVEAILAEHDGISLSWSAISFIEAKSKLKKSQVDVLIIDIKMEASHSGIDVLKYVDKRYPRVKTLVLSAYAPPRFVREACIWGAKGYFAKEETGEGLVAALFALGRGTATGFLGPFSALAKPNIFLDISAREKEVLLELARGHSNSEIADMLGLKVGTIKTHLESIYRKLNVSNRTDAFRAALAEGYLSFEELT